VQAYVNKMSWIYPSYPFGGIGVFRDFLGISFSINHVENTGAAWGIFNKFPSFLFFVRMVIVTGLIVYLALRSDRRRDLPLLLIITGAIGNMLDYIFYKKVIDMFHFNFWGYSYPVFNIADMMITIGIIWLFLVLIKKKG
jgi:signal peptidase II